MTKPAMLGSKLHIDIYIYRKINFLERYNDNFLWNQILRCYIRKLSLDML